MILNKKCILIGYILFLHSIHNIYINIFLIYSMSDLGITDIYYGIILKYLGKST